MTDEFTPEPTQPRRAAAAATAAPSRKRARRVSPLTVLGVLLLVIGLASMGYIAYQYYGTNVSSAASVKKQKQELRQDWQKPAAGAAVEAPQGKPIPGNAIALLRIPDLGKDYEQPIITGTGPEELAKGVGWYEKTSKPGEIGNFAVAGHRITHGEPFAKLLELNKGAEVQVETRDTIYTYKLTSAPRDLTVNDKDGVWVLDPVPHQPRTPDAKPTLATITLTTCTDLFASPDRSVAFGELVKTEKKNTKN